MAGHPSDPARFDWHSMCFISPQESSDTLAQCAPMWEIRNRKFACPLWENYEIQVRTALRSARVGLPMPFTPTPVLSFIQAPLHLLPPRCHLSINVRNSGIDNAAFGRLDVLVPRGGRAPAPFPQSFRHIVEQVEGTTGSTP